MEELTGVKNSQVLGVTEMKWLVKEMDQEDGALQTENMEDCGVSSRLKAPRLLIVCFHGDRACSRRIYVLIKSRWRAVWVSSIEQVLAGVTSRSE